MRRRIGSFERSATTRAPTATAAHSIAIIGVTNRNPIRYVARKRLGRVAMSPAAVTMGAATLSRSRLRFAQNAATATVITSTTTDEMMAPITEITMKSTMEIVGVSKNAAETALASTAKAKEIDSESRIAAPTFCPKSVSTRFDTRKVPAWIWVPRRLPRPPKMLPRIPIAAGIRMTRPGSVARGVGNRREREPGYEIAARRDEERDEAGADSVKVRAHERDKARADETREAKHFELGGSDIRYTSGEVTRLPRQVTH
jgi:hypothetical protein